MIIEYNKEKKQVKLYGTLKLSCHGVISGVHSIESIQILGRTLRNKKGKIIAVLHGGLREIEDELEINGEIKEDLIYDKYTK